MRKIACTMLLSVALVACSDNDTPAAPTPTPAPAPAPAPPPPAPAPAPTPVPAPTSPTTPSPVPPTTATIKVIGFDDFHGALATVGTQAAPNPAMPGTNVNIPVGGAAYMTSLIKSLKAKNPLNVVVGGGDMVGATPIVSALFHDEPTIDALDLIGLEFSSVGNHEFDDGKAELMRLQNGGCFPGGTPGTDTCLDTGNTFSGASFKYLAANVVNRDTGRPLFPAFGIKSFDVGTGVPLRMGFIGLVLRETPTIVSAQGVEGLDFIDEAFAANAAVDQLRSEGIESIVVLIHQGGMMTSVFNDTACNGFVDNPASQQIINIAKKLDTAVDLIVAGHSHNALLCKGKISTNPKLAITSTRDAGRMVSEIDLTVNLMTGDVTDSVLGTVLVVNDTAANPAPAAYPTQTADVQTKALVDKYTAAAAPLANRVIGRITADIRRAQNAAGESALGDVIADSQLAATQGNSQRAVVAFMNPGGIRTDLLASQISGSEAVGEVTYGEAFAVQPIGNSLTTLTLTGAQIDTLLEQQFPPNQTGGTPRILQVSNGFTYTYDNNGPANAKVDIATIRINGTPIVAGDRYRVTVNSFLAGGGDAFSILTQGTEIFGGSQDIDAQERFLTANAPVPPGPQNRITRLN